MPQDEALEARKEGLRSRSPLQVEEVVPIEGTAGENRKRMVLNMGPVHPSTHGVLRVITTLEGERVVEAKPDIGYLHRNWEKIVEGWPYPHAIPFSDRNDYLSPIHNEFAYTMALEKLFEVEVPERAEYLRVLMAEINRVGSHLIAFGTYGLDLAAVSAFLLAFEGRDKMYDIFERVSGARMLPNYFRVGGVRNDMSDDTLAMIAQFCDDIEQRWDKLWGLLIENKIFQYRTKDVGVITKEQAISGGASGPQARASGVDWDLRRDQPYSIYDRLDFDVIVRENGDCYDRTVVRMLEILESTKIIRQCLDQIPEGEVQGKVPRRLVADEGSVYQAFESSRGEIGVYIVSQGGRNPYRVKWRDPSFVNLSLLPIAAEGGLIADLVAVIGSLDPVFGGVDR